MQKVHEDGIGMGDMSINADGKREAIALSIRNHFKEINETNYAEGWNNDLDDIYNPTL
jgi:mRNA deadenylase 3'-5' endonuclease subunit Ccr4